MTTNVSRDPPKHLVDLEIKAMSAELLDVIVEALILEMEFEGCARVQIKLRQSPHEDSTVERGFSEKHAMARSPTPASMT
jgi:hypothetical protein